MTKLEIGQLLSDQVTDVLQSVTGRKLPMIEADVFDDEDAIGLDCLERWHDRDYSKHQGYGPIWTGDKPLEAIDFSMD